MNWNKNGDASVWMNASTSNGGGDTPIPRCQSQRHVQISEKGQE
jgi:hypothetical protein